ncbi:hypothetical protein ElyMa_004766700 [Elysia marginata]|uniref:Uncharacterized protein n=1 Tax=Elysia marginata TaxID=1093978 RepID=A0AAV4IFX8_9GAST|nr:hypothetical protein ElyMa_004766700 [Elysia marginata]
MYVRNTIIRARTGACMQKATRIPVKASPTVGPSGTKRQRTAKGDLEDDGGEGSERKRSLSLETVPLTAADRPRWRALQLPQAPDGVERIEGVSVCQNVFGRWTL